MLRKQLYRPEALDAKQIKWLGEVVMIRPISFIYFTFFAVILAIILIALLSFGTYTKRSTVSGQLVPDSGLIKIFTPQPGIVLRKLVGEDQSVKRGDVLYILSSERQSSTQGDTQAMISKEVESREESLVNELDKTRHLQLNERDALLEKIAGLQTELLKINDQINDQKIRVELSEKTTVRYQGLLAQDFISQELLQQKQEDLLDQRNRLQSLERDQINARLDLTARQKELSSLAFKQQNELAQINRNLISAKQELTESEAKRSIVITAPENGTATAVIAETGQVVDTNKPLVNIVPKGAKLQAQLFAPSNAVGFIKVGDRVLLRYQAYPYQKFGQHRGIVVSVSKTALPSSELFGMGNVAGIGPNSNNTMIGSGGNNEPLYRITVDLATQQIKIYGKKQPLQAGMLLQADVLQETRRLYEWVLEPLYSLTGRL